MDGKFLFQKRLSLKGFFCLASYFLPEIAMQNNFRKFEELVFCDLWFLDSGFRIPVSDSGFRFRILASGFRVLGLPVAGYSAVNSTANLLLDSFIIFPWPAHPEGYGLIFLSLGADMGKESHVISSDQRSNTHKRQRS